VTWVVRGQYPSGDVVEEFATVEAAQEAIERHQERPEYRALYRRQQSLTEATQSARHSKEKETKPGSVED